MGQAPAQSCRTRPTPRRLAPNRANVGQSRLNFVGRVADIDSTWAVSAEFSPMLSTASGLCEAEADAHWDFGPSLPAPRTRLSS